MECILDLRTGQDDINTGETISESPQQFRVVHLAKLVSNRQGLSQAVDPMVDACAVPGEREVMVSFPETRDIYRNG